tara:strand:- start:2842 stop:3006 length:165 start_codon:yes stop_codon:yes gene_type:complete
LLRQFSLEADEIAPLFVSICDRIETPLFFRLPSRFSEELESRWNFITVELPFRF